MNWKRLVAIGRAEYRVLAVGAYSFAAFTFAAMVQILSSGTAEPAMHPHLALLAFAVLPLVVAGLALDFYCLDRPKMAMVANLLCALIGGLIGTVSNSLAAVLGLYSAQVATYAAYGSWAAVAVLVAVVVIAAIVDPRAEE